MKNMVNVKRETLLFAVAVGIGMTMILYAVTHSNLSQGTSLAPAFCRSTTSSFNCNAPLITYNSNDTLSNLMFEYANDTNTTLYNLQISCTSNKTAENTPVPQGKFKNLTFENWDSLVQSNLTSASWPANHGYLINNVHCYGKTSPYLTQTNGFVTAYIWINYTLMSGSPNATTNPFTTKEIAVIGAKVV